MTTPTSVYFFGTCLVDLDAVFERLGDRVRYHIEIKGWDDLLPLRLLERIDAHDLDRDGDRDRQRQRALGGFEGFWEHLPRGHRSAFPNFN